ncbi:hypothetical protein WDU94_000650 [Cyamophila willieti]
MAKIIPSPKSLPLVGTLFSLLKEGGGAQLHKYVERRHQELGPIYKETIGPVEAYFVNSPSDMRQVFAAEGTYPVHILPECWIKYNSLYGCNRGIYFMDGQEWMKHRKIMNKYLLKSFSPNLQHTLTKDLLKQFEKNIVSSGGIDVECHLYQLSINFVIAHMLGTPFITNYQSLTKDILALSKVVHKIFEYSVALSLLPINLSVRLSLPAWTNFVHAVNSSLKLASSLCDTMEEFRGDGLMSKLKQEGVTVEMIRRIVVDFILASGDTTAVATQWALYLLGRHPAVQDNLHEELSQHFENHCLESDTLTHIIRETLRLYPIAPFIGRFIPQDLELHGYVIPTNSLVLLSVYSASQDPSHFPSPDEFLPQRWARDSSGKYCNVRDPYASIPYAMGARSCIGRKLAQTQMCLSIAQIIKNYKVEVKTPVDVVLKLITVPSKPIKFEFTPR